MNLVICFSLAESWELRGGHFNLILLKQWLWGGIGDGYEDHGDDDEDHGDVNEDHDDDNEDHEDYFDEEDYDRELGTQRWPLQPHPSDNNDDYD